MVNDFILSYKQASYVDEIFRLQAHCNSVSGGNTGSVI